MGLKKVIHEELQSLIEYPQQGIYNIHDLAALMQRMGFDKEGTGHLANLLVKEFQSGGDDAVVQKYAEMTGTQIYPVSRGRYVFQTQPHDPKQGPYLEEQLDEIIDLLEGVGDKYAEKKWGIPDDAQQKYLRQTASAAQTADMGEMVGRSTSNYNQSDQSDIYLNPTSLKDFEAGVRAVSDPEGNLYVAQHNGDFIHQGMQDSVPRYNIYRNDLVITWHRVGNSNVFGYSDSFTGYGLNNSEEMLERLEVLRQKHPNYRFVPEYYFGIDEHDPDIEKRQEPVEHFEEGLGDKYAEKQFGIPDTGEEFKQYWQQHQKTQDRSAENGELVAQVTSAGEGVGNWEVKDDFKVNIYKNPKSLRNFEEFVRAVGDEQGNIYVAQINGSFYHNDIENEAGVYGQHIIYFYRVGVSNLFGVSGTYLRKITGREDANSEIGIKWIQEHPYEQEAFKALNRNNPNLRFSYYPAHNLMGNRTPEDEINKSVLKEYQTSSDHRLMEMPENLIEGLSDIVYHYTYTGNIPNILVTDKLNTSNNIGTTADAQKDKGRKFYFSMQRTKGKSGYAKAHGSDAVLVLDGRKLMSRYKGAPIDYWNWSMAKKDWDDNNAYIQALQSKELEDRIFTDEPYIEKASEYIKEIHIDLSKPWYLKKSKADDIEKFAKHVGIPVYFYDDKNQYQLQNKANAKPLADINTEFKDENEEEYDRESNDFYWMFKEFVPYIFYDTKYESEFWKLFKKFLKSRYKEREFDTYKQEIDKRVQEVSDFYRKEGYRYWFYLQDKYRSWMADFHNRKSSTDPYYREFLRLLVRDMRDFNADDLKSYLISKLRIPDENVNEGMAIGDNSGYMQFGIKEVEQVVREEIQFLIKNNEVDEANISSYEDKNYGVLKSTGKRFWIGTVSVLDGKIEEVHTYEEAKKHDFHHSFYFSSCACEKIDNEESMVFWVDKHGINGEWTHGKIPQDIINVINQQILIQ